MLTGFIYGNDPVLVFVDVRAVFAIFAVKIFEELLLFSRHVVKLFFAAVSKRGQTCALTRSLRGFLFATSLGVPVLLVKV